MIKQSWDYESKQAARRSLCNFILKHKDGLAVPLKEAKVVCLPGYDENSKSSLEIEKVYDKVGVRRENIVGIEQDKKIYEKLENADLGIELYLGSDGAFFNEKNGKRFDIVSLDYTGQYSRKRMNDLCNLFKNQILNEKSILYTNFFGARESDLTQRLYNLYLSDGMLWEFIEDVVGIKKDKSAEGIRIHQIAEAMQKRELVERRDDGISWNILNLAYDARVLDENFNYEMAKKDTGFMKDLKDMRDELIHHDAELFEKLEKLDIIMDKDLGDDDGFAMLYNIYSKKPLLFISKLRKDLMSQGFSDEEARIINSYFIPIENQAYFCEDMQRNNYRNVAGKLMMGDLFFFDQKREKFNLPVKIENIDGVNKLSIKGKIAASPFKGYEKKILNDMKRIVITNALAQRSIPPRIDLGSSYKPKADNDTLKGELLNGTPEEEIYEKYRDVNPRTIAAIKAHITMGTYRKNNAM